MTPRGDMRCHAGNVSLLRIDAQAVRIGRRRGREPAGGIIHGQHVETGAKRSSPR
jgi:hypothetical protein